MATEANETRVWKRAVRSVGLLVIALPLLLYFMAAPAGAVAQTDSAPEGAKVFAGECAGCHGARGEGALEGPSLQSVLGDQAAVTGVAEIVRHGYGEMDPFESKLTEDQIQAVANYVVSSFGVTGDVPQGGVLFRLNCAGCHGASARGGALIYSEDNAPSLLDVTTPEVSAAVRSGPSTMPAYNEGALTDAQVASIASYVASIQSPPQPGGLEMTYHGPVSEGLIAIVGGLGAAILAALWMERGGRG